MGLILWDQTQPRSQGLSLSRSVGRVGENTGNEGGTDPSFVQ